MISFLLYMMVGALLMAFTFKMDKLFELLPTWYTNYTIAMTAEGKEMVDRKLFDRVIFITIFLVYIFGWPAVLWKLVGKLIKGDK